MKIERVPSLTCNRCGSFQVMQTERGLECDECNRHVSVKQEMLTQGININETVIEFKLQQKEN